jgi:aspartate aminotransferase-like enzyme
MPHIKLFIPGPVEVSESVLLDQSQRLLTVLARTCPRGWGFS